MKIKTKISLALASLFVAIVGIVAVSWYYIEDLSAETENILKDNYESIQFTKRIIVNCDSLSVDPKHALAAMEQSIRQQEENVTEMGERELTLQLRKAFEQLQTHTATDEEIAELRRITLALQQINMDAIVAKSEVAIETGANASSYLMFIAAAVGIVAFTFILNFPGYLANPIVALTSSIQSIANKDYEERLHFDRTDEFGELAEAFNRMAEKLDEYEHSNLAQILFEKKRIETIINRMTDPVIGIDEHKRVVFVNDQALQLLHLHEALVVGRYAPDVALENDLFRNLIRPAVNGDTPTPNLIKVVVEGRENYFSKEDIAIKYKPTGEKEQVPVGNVILLKNITPYKERDLAKTNFIATISHELKTPIASLQLGIKLLQDGRVGSLNVEQQSIVKTINDETQRLARITGELLDLSQVETGNIKLELQSVDVHDIVAFGLESVKFQAERKGINIEAQLPDVLPPVKADRDKTVWVLVNLLTNAIRYSAENGTVRVQAFAIDKAVKVSVLDQGPGIEEKYLSKLFDKYFQVPGSRSGTGLGLAISKEFIEAQGGSISVRSELGQGSTFEFQLDQILP